MLPLIIEEFDMSAVEQGLIAASTLAGIFFGGPVFGQLADRFGRRTIFLIDLIAFVVLGLAQVLVGNFLWLFILRLALGLAIGAEYAIGQTMLAEFVPRKGRGMRLASLQAAWYGGFLLAVVVAYLLVAVGLDWRWILATGAGTGPVHAAPAPGTPRVPAMAGQRGPGGRGP